MKSLLFFILLSPSLLAQFVTPDWRSSENSEHAAWDIFTEAKINPNSPDVHSDAPTDDAQITCITSSAFLTSSKNIYSFQATTTFQLSDSTTFPIHNVFLQISAQGSELDPSSVKLFSTSPTTGDTTLILPSHSFILDQKTLTGEFGGLGTTYAFQWDLSNTPVSGTYKIIFSAAETSMSLDEVSLDTSGSYLEVPIPPRKTPNPVMSFSEEMVTLTWPEDYLLESTTDLSTWAGIEATTTTNGKNSVTLPLSTQAVFFRLKPSEEVLLQE